MVAVRELVRREFVVDVGLRDAWDYLANVESWTSWAKHIKRVTLQPPGSLTDHSARVVSPRGRAVDVSDGGIRTADALAVVGRFFTANVHYDHRSIRAPSTTGAGPSSAHTVARLSVRFSFPTRWSVIRLEPVGRLVRHLRSGASCGFQATIAPTSEPPTR